MRESALEQGDFVWLAGSLCQVNRIPFDPALLLQRYPAPHSRRQLIEASNSLGFKTGELAFAAERLRELRYPCVGFLNSDPPQPALLVNGDSTRFTEKL